MFFHSSSYTANPIACAAANANLAIWREEPMRERIATLIGWQTALLERFAALPGVVRTRQAGTIIAFDIEDRGESGYLSDIAPRLRQHCLDKDVLLRPLGNTVYLMPPYCIEEAQLAHIGNVLTDGIAAIG